MCIFCKIINNEIPSYSVYEDEKCIAILDAFPAAPGHTLIMPKKHIDNILGLDDELTIHLFKVTQHLTKKVAALDGVKGLNVLNNCGEKAGQSVNHIHIHIIPRYDDDKISMSFPSNQLPKEQMEEILNKLK